MLGDLARLGFDAEWENIPASVLGAPHRRERVWLVAHTPKIGHASGFLSWSCASRNEEWETGTPLLPSYYDGRGEAPDSSSVRKGYGFSEFMGELNGYGNAVVPQIPEIIGRAILKAEGRIAA